MKSCVFWAFFAMDALIGAMAVGFFFLGLADGSVSSFNIGVWIAILVVPAAMIGGAFWLKAAGRPILGTILLLVLAAPGILYGVFIVTLLVTNSRWN